MVILRLQALLLCLIAQVASIYPQINRLQLDYDSFPKGTKPVSILRTLKLDFTYNLAGIKDTGIPWTKYPELDDQIELDFAQYVRISYRISAYFHPINSHFCTRLLIDNQVDNRFFFVTGSSSMERTHVGEGRVWLPKGTHTIRIEYIVTNNVPVQKLNEWGIANYLEIEYYKLVSIN